VAGGITLATGGEGGQFGTFDYENPAHRAECEKAVRLAAKHFDEVILDDFFFYTSKSPADIAAKGDRSWSAVPAGDHAQGQPGAGAGSRQGGQSQGPDDHQVPQLVRAFPRHWLTTWKSSRRCSTASIPAPKPAIRSITDQLLQQYESYSIIRYFDNIRPHRLRNGKKGNGGGWVDTFSTLYVDRYAEQLWDTLLAKAPEITLFNWRPMSEAQGRRAPAQRPWQDKATSFDWKAMVASYKPSGQANDPGPGWGRAAGWSLEKIDKDLGYLGKPIGIASYKPYQSSGEDFLHNYLGNVGIPIELSPNFPKGADVALLTQAAAKDPRIVDEIKGNLLAGKAVFITSGLLSARCRARGIEDILEVRDTGRKVALARLPQRLWRGQRREPQRSEARHPRRCCFLS
jgi:hypothetical protein